MILYFTFVK